MGWIVILKKLEIDSDIYLGLFYLGMICNEWKILGV